MKLIRRFCLVLAALLTACLSLEAAGTELWNAGVSLIPYPQSVELDGDIFVLGNRLEIVLDKDAAPADKFAAEELSRRLEDKWHVQCEIAASPSGKSIVLTRQGAPERIGEQGYSLGVAAGGITVRAGGEAGLFYGVQTLLQLIQDEGHGPFIKGMEIVDWPDIPERAVHYDTKHFQESFEYVKGFIRTLASYKINMLIWEWEDKFAYPSHPDLGAPGAFTLQEMQELTHFARKYHVHIVPLVQGLGHVSFVLKHPQYKHLREIASDNWGFCPLREGTYELMFDLLEDAIQATPGSDYIHLGCDETYVLGKGVECGCQDKVAEIGRHGLLMKYIERCAERMKSKGRKVLSWGGVYDSKEKIKPPSELITFSVGEDAPRDSMSRAAGYPVWIYDPNPGIEHLFLPYFYRLNSKGKEVRAHLAESCQTMSQAALSGIYDGMVTTSWNCSGVHNQFWMLRYITAAEFTWSGGNPTREEFEEKFFANYYGSRSSNVKELYELLNRASYYYMDTFERRVWHWGEVGKTNLPDLPRDDIEYDPFWNTRYKEMIEHSREQLPKMARALEICRINQQSGAGNSYDFELFSVLAELIQHTANTYLALSELENAIKEAHRVHFDSNQEAFASLGRAAGIVEKNLAERDEVFNRIVTTWEKCQLPRGMSTPEKKYVHGRDQQRNFANRRPDLTFMIYDEQRLGLEEYLGKLRSYIDWYGKTYLQ